MEVIEKKTQIFSKKNRNNQQNYDKKVECYIQTFQATILKADIYIKNIYIHT